MICEKSSYTFFGLKNYDYRKIKVGTLKTHIVYLRQ